MQMTTPLKQIILVICFCPCFGGFASTGQTPRVVSVCQILQNPSWYTRRDVAIHARVLSDGEHSTLLIDDHCPKTGIPIGTSDGEEDESVAQLGRYILKVGKPGTQGKLITGQFVGRMRVPKDRRRLTFDLKLVRHLRLVETPVEIKP